MTNRIRRLSVSVCALALLVSTSVAQSAATYRDLPNFHQVSEKLYRGGQPAGGAMKILSGLGIKAVINLRGEDELSNQEQKQAEAAGLRYFNVSMPGLSAPSDEQVARLLALMDDPANQPVFIHCKRGSDRTGTMVAVYRIAHEGWTAEQATAEAQKHGLSWMEFGMRGFISDYYKRRIRSQNQPAAATSH
jgi:tyrosine-protein phosphatase SIW14